MPTSKAWKKRRRWKHWLAGGALLLQRDADAVAPGASDALLLLRAPLTERIGKARRKKKKDERRERRRELELWKR